MFLLVWEHSHYVLFIQALCLFLLDSFDLVPPRKVKKKNKKENKNYYILSQVFFEGKLVFILFF